MIQGCWKQKGAGLKATGELAAARCESRTHVVYVPDLPMMPGLMPGEPRVNHVYDGRLHASKYDPQACTCEGPIKHMSITTVRVTSNDPAS